MSNLLEKPFQDDVEHTQQKNNDGDLVDTVHHPDVNVNWSVWVFSAEEISPNFAQRKKFFQSAFLLLLPRI
jgi:hypothetical protein